MLFNQLIRPGSAIAVSALILGAVHVGAAHAQAGEPKVRQAIKEELGSNRSAAQSQRRIDRLDDETQGLLSDYRLTVRETDSLRRYNEQLERQIQSQLNEIAAIEDELTRIEETNREVLPMMLRMVNTLDQFVKLDMPFLQDERSKRLDGLKDIMDRADVTTSEKYRRILEAYQVEMEYGRTIEAYEAKLATASGDKTVDFLRVGRVALMYQTKDTEETGRYNPESGKWEVVNDYREAVLKGLRIAKKQAAPDLLIMPIDAAKGAK